MIIFRTICDTAGRFAPSIGNPMQYLGQQISGHFLLKEIQRIYEIGAEPIIVAFRIIRSGAGRIAPSIENSK